MSEIMIIYMYIAPGQGRAFLWGQNLFIDGTEQNRTKLDGSGDLNVTKNENCNLYSHILHKRV